MGVTGWMLVLLVQAAPQLDSGTAGAERQIDVTQVVLPATVDVQSSMAKRFKLMEVRVAIDGQDVAHRVAARGQELEQQFRAYEGDVSPGQHHVTVNLVFEGRNVGIFTYMDDYKIRMQSSGDFMAQDRAHPATVQVLAYERSGVTIPVEKRPTMEIKATGAPGTSAVRASTQPAGR